jgi:cytochrome c551/c552
VAFLVDVSDMAQKSYRRFPWAGPFGVLILAFPEVAFAQWVQFVDQTGTRLVAAPDVGVNNGDEKDYAWGDVDQDGDVDLVAVYKQGWTTTGRRRNALFMNEGIKEGHAINGVLVDRSAVLIPQFLDLTNDRDVILVDVNKDGWLDIVTATTLSGSQPKSISHPRVYINRQLDGQGNWLGYIFDDENRVPTMPVEPRFCGVAAGDVDGDGDMDLYFSDYDQGPYARPQDLNDRLWINDGQGYFTDQTATRMTPEMVLSAFGMATAIADMNGDGVVDVVKDTALAFPQRVSISYNDPDNEGFFDEFDVVYDNAPYHVSVGELNNDNKLDLVITDDGSDRYLLNQGNNASGIATFIERIFQGTNPGDFGGEQVIADLNNDGFEDVFITDVDVDIPGCTRQSKIYRNLGDVPTVTLAAQGNAGIATADITGLHDVAILDIDGDGWKDVVLGKCSGTKVYMNQPPAGLLFSYPSGLPYFVRPDIGAEFLIQVSGQPGAVPQPGTGMLFVSVNNGPFTNVPIFHLGNNLYAGRLPGGTCTNRLRYYLRAQSTVGGIFYDPPTAPAQTYAAVLAVNSVITLRDEIEGNVSSWTIVNDPSLASGAWEQADPNGTVFAGDQAAPEDDATQAANKVMAFVTGNGPAGGAAADFDVDGGPTRLLSPVIDLEGTDATISYSRWFYCDNQGTAQGDVFVVEVSNDGGNNWTVVESVSGTDSSWTTGSFLVGDHVTPTNQVRVRFSVSDTPNNSVTEAGIDNFQVEELSCFLCIVTEECVDTNPCTDEVCNHGICEYSNNSVPCDDNNLCTVNDVCSVGNCIGTHISGCVPCTGEGECDDGNPCTEDACVGSVCEHKNNTLPCDDGNLCTINDVCSQGECGGDIIPDCEPCETDADCDDGRFCNGVETCDGSTCLPGTRPCEVGQPCDELTDTCTLVLQARLGDPLLGLSAQQLARFLAGQAEFDRDFAAEDGLGPIFNQSSCGQCHNAGGIGGAGSITVLRFGRVDKGGFDPLADLGGSLLQLQAIDDTCRENIPEEANITAVRLTPPIFGAGLVETIADADILLNMANFPPGINGTPHFVPAFEDPGGRLRVGRFGWKAQVATLLTFSADASLNELGITNRFLPLENAPNGDQDLLAQCDSVADPEDGPDAEGLHFIDRVTDFQRFLAQPPQTPKSGMSGEAIFAEIGCAACHRPQYVTGTATEAVLSNRTIRPYSDFLLHDMGVLSDGIAQGDAPGNRMRTPTLWGLRVRDPVLHNGSVAGGTFAERVYQVIDRHGLPGSEAVGAAASFGALSLAEQEAVIAFLDSLGRAEFDHDGDNIINESDFLAFWACYRDAGTSVTPDEPCAISDVEQDGDVDAEDFSLFLTAFDGVPPDCNTNGAVDFQEMVDGTGGDCNGNAVLDDCDGFACDDANSCTDDACAGALCAFVNNSAACDDGNACSRDDVCSAGLCAGVPIVVLFGDIAPTGGDGAVDVDDITCVVFGYANATDCPGGDVAPCERDGQIDVDDLVAIVAAFAGLYPCPHPCPPL